MTKLRFIGYCTNQFTISRLFSRVTEMSSVCESVAHDVSKPIESVIRHKLTSCLNPVHLEVINESYMHNAPKGSESHFKVVVVSEKFESLPLIKRHRLVNEALQQELQTSIHALSISAKTPTQWAESSQVIEPSPSCRGGFGK